MPSLDQNRQSAINAADEHNLLLSGGSLDNFLTKHRETPRQSSAVRPVDEVPTRPPGVPPMSNLIIAMALQNNFTLNSLAEARTID